MAALTRVIVGVIVVLAADTAGGDGCVAARRSTPDERKHAWERHHTVLFFAGLEGTGHHLWREHVRYIWRRAPGAFKAVGLTQWTDEEQRQASGRIDSFLKDQEYRPNKSAQLTEASIERLAEDLCILTAPNSSQTPERNPGVLALNCGKTMHSYPRAAPAHQPKAFSVPNLMQFRMAASKAGMRMRVIVLLRDHAQILRSAASRGYGGSLHKEALTLGLAACLLAYQLRHMPAHDVLCVNAIDELPTAGESALKQLMDFMHPDLNTTAREALAYSITTEHRREAPTSAQAVKLPDDPDERRNFTQAAAHLGEVVHETVTRACWGRMLY